MARYITNTIPFAIIYAGIDIPKPAKEKFIAINIIKTITQRILMFTPSLVLLY